MKKILLNSLLVSICLLFSCANNKPSEKIIEQGFRKAWNDYANGYNWNLKEVTIGDIKTESKAKTVIASIKFTFIAGGSEITKTGEFTFRKFNDSWEMNKDDLGMIVGR